MIRRPPRSTRTDTLFPYTTLFRSHATHLTPEETRGIADSGATVAICPTTEANLGDGLFPLRAYLDAGGAWGIGSDSHISVSPVEELRWLEYGQRLVAHHRNIAVVAGSTSGGETRSEERRAGNGRVRTCRPRRETV